MVFRLKKNKISRVATQNTASHSRLSLFASKLSLVGISIMCLLPEVRRGTIDPISLMQLGRSLVLPVAGYGECPVFICHVP